MLKVFPNWYCHLRCVRPRKPKLPKITSLLFLCNMLRKLQLIFYIQISKKACYILILRFLWWVWSWWSIPKVLKKASLQCFYNIPENVRDKVDIFDIDKHQSFLTVDFNTLDIKFFYNVIDMIMKTWKASRWKWWSILKVPKVTSLQCL